MTDKIQNRESVVYGSTHRLNCIDIYGTSKMHNERLSESWEYRILCLHIILLNWQQREYGIMRSGNVILTINSTECKCMVLIRKTKRMHSIITHGECSWFVSRFYIRPASYTSNSFKFAYTKSTRLMVMES